MTKKIVVYEFKNFNPRTHRYKRYRLGRVNGQLVQYLITPYEYKELKKKYGKNLKIRKVV